MSENLRQQVLESGYGNAGELAFNPAVANNWTAAKEQSCGRCRFFTDRLKLGYLLPQLFQRASSPIRATASSALSCESKFVTAAISA
jgi:hypothetical protein